MEKTQLAGHREIWLQELQSKNISPQAGGHTMLQGWRSGTGKAGKGQGRQLTAVWENQEQSMAHECREDVIEGQSSVV